MTGVCPISRGWRNWSRSARRTGERRSARALPADTFLRAYGLPHLLKFAQTPGLLVMLNGMNAGYRQCSSTGGRSHDPCLRGRAFVRDLVGRHARRERERVPQRPLDRLERKHDDGGRENRGGIPRPDYGHLEVEVSVDDPKAYTKPWKVTLKQRLAVDTELVDEIASRTRSRLSA